MNSDFRWEPVVLRVYEEGRVCSYNSDSHALRMRRGGEMRWCPWYAART